jgi:hypothetical protein
MNPTEKNPENKHEMPLDLIQHADDCSDIVETQEESVYRARKFGYLAAGLPTVGAIEVFAAEKIVNLPVVNDRNSGIASFVGIVATAFACSRKINAEKSVEDRHSNEPQAPTNNPISPNKPAYNPE